MTSCLCLENHRQRNSWKQVIRLEHLILKHWIKACGIKVNSWGSLLLPGKFGCQLLAAQPQSRALEKFCVVLSLELFIVTLESSRVLTSQIRAFNILLFLK